LNLGLFYFPLTGRKWEVSPDTELQGFAGVLPLTIAPWCSQLLARWL